MLKDDNEDVNQDVPDNMYDMLVIEFLTQRKDDKVALVNFEVNIKLVQTSDSWTDDDEDVLDIVSTIRINVSEKRVIVNVTSAHMDNVPFHSETSVQKLKYVVQRRIAA